MPKWFDMFTTLILDIVMAKSVLICIRFYWRPSALFIIYLCICLGPCVGSGQNNQSFSPIKVFSKTSASFCTEIGCWGLGVKFSKTSFRSLVLLTSTQFIYPGSWDDPTQWTERRIWAAEHFLLPSPTLACLLMLRAMVNRLSGEELLPRPTISVAAVVQGRVDCQCCVPHCSCCSRPGTSWLPRFVG